MNIHDERVVKINATIITKLAIASRSILSETVKGSTALDDHKDGNINLLDSLNIIKHIVTSKMRGRINDSATK